MDRNDFSTDGTLDKTLARVEARRKRERQALIRAGDGVSKVWIVMEEGQEAMAGIFANEQHARRFAESQEPGRRMSVFPEFVRYTDEVIPFP